MSGFGFAGNGWRGVVLGGAAFALSLASAAAQTPPAAPPGPAPAAPPAVTPPAAPPPAEPMIVQMPLINEVKTGILAHDVGFLGDHIETGADVNLEVLFNSPDFLHAIGSPRPMIGGDINTAGKTSDGYFGLTWGITLIQNLFGWGGSVYANGGLGAAINDGYGDNAPPGRKDLGSPVLFHLSAELGYQFTPTFSVSAFLDHMSNANLANHNAGITNAGARFGVKF
ncbi:MAG TPA: acyloxyacyl hydrolase [Stellaceae bacterium]|nr:acyloxyacyl hydrolase [Stellaceae bacterium]